MVATRVVVSSSTSRPVMIRLTFESKRRTKRNCEAAREWLFKPVVTRTTTGKWNGTGTVVPGMVSGTLRGTCTEFRPQQKVAG